MKPHLIGIIKERPPLIEGESSNAIKWITAILLGALGIWVLTSNRKKLPVALLCTSCANGTIPMAFKPVGFSSDEIQGLKDDAEQWNSKSKGKYSLIIDENCPEDACSIIRKVDVIPDNPKAAGECIAHIDKFGVSFPNDCATSVKDNDDIETFEINISPTTNGIPNNVQCVALHELGHVFGKPHDSDPNTVMFANSVLCELTEKDVQ